MSKVAVVAICRQRAHYRKIWRYPQTAVKVVAFATKKETIFLHFTKKSQKMRPISATVWPISTKFGMRSFILELFANWSSVNQFMCYVRVQCAPLKASSCLNQITVTTTCHPLIYEDEDISSRQAVLGGQMARANSAMSTTRKMLMKALTATSADVADRTHFQQPSLGKGTDAHYIRSIG